MTVAKITTLNNYTGVAADTKPTASDVVVGSRFVETDTGMSFIYDGSAWKPMRAVVVGAVADDVAAAGNPLPIAGLADDTSPDSVDEGDTGTLAMTLSRELYVRPMRRGAGEVITVRGVTGSTASTRATIVDPTSGKKIRILSVFMYSDSTVLGNLELYFADSDSPGANINTTGAKAIMRQKVDYDATAPELPMVWPDGAGPVGAVDDLLSIRCGEAIGANGVAIVLYREE